MLYYFYQEKEAFYMADLDDVTQENKSMLIEEAKTSKNKQTTKAMAIIGAVLLIVGVLLGVLLYQFSVTARVTEVMTMNDNGYQYEKYEIRYTFMGEFYIGVGTDELEYNSETNTYEYDIKENEEYPLYVAIIAPSKYHFQRSYVSFVLGGIFLASGAGLLIAAFVLRKKFLISISSVGDLNNDGKVNEIDLRMYAKAEEEKEALEKERIRKKDFCKYCGSKLLKTDLFCPQCGAKREE